MRVKKRGEDARGRPTIVCEMTIAYKMIHETFTTLVTLDRTELEIIVDYLRGPFRRLENRWRFRPLAARMCEVEFNLLYEFQSRTLGMLMGAMFEAVFRRFADAFERRGGPIYGQPAPARMGGGPPRPPPPCLFAMLAARVRARPTERC